MPWMALFLEFQSNWMGKMRCVLPRLPVHDFWKTNHKYEWMFFARARIWRGDSSLPAWPGTDFAARRRIVVTRRESFDRLLASLYEAMLDDDCWPAASGLIDEICGTRGNLIVTGEGETGSEVNIFFTCFCYNGERHADLEELYFSTYHASDERLPRLRRLPDSELVHVDQLFSEKEKRTSPVYNEALPLATARDSLNVRLNGFGGSRIVMSLGDPVDRDGWSTPRVESARALLPHLRQYGLVRQMLKEAQARADTFASLLEFAGCGMIQLDRHGRVIEANDRSRRWLRAADGLTDAGAALQASRPAEDAELQRLLVRALSPRQDAVGGSTTLRRKNSSGRLAVHVMPLRKTRVTGLCEGTAALVLVAESGGAKPVPGSRNLEKALGLTAIETQIAVLLAQGRSLREIAEEDGRSYYTIRWHVQNIFQKLGVSRQADLVRVIWSLTGIESREKAPD